MVFISVVVLGDGVLLLFDPALYRRCVDYAEETVGPSWPMISGLLLILAGLFIFITGVCRAISVIFGAMGCVLGLVGVFAILAGTEDYRYLGQWWKSRPNAQYRVAGIVLVILSVAIMRFAMEIR